MILSKEFISLFAIACVAGSGTLYLWQILTRRIKPHIFTWIIWTLLMIIGFFIQYIEKAGPGMWVLAATILANISVVIASFFYGEKNITRSDSYMFIAALCAVPIWLIASDPLWAAIIITVIDLMAGYPTFRKSWIKPHQESASFFLVALLPFPLSVAALDIITPTTAMYPIAISAMYVALILMLFYRRRMLKDTPSLEISNDKSLARFR